MYRLATSGSVSKDALIDAFELNDRCEGESVIELDSSTLVKTKPAPDRGKMFAELHLGFATTTAGVLWNSEALDGFVRLCKDSGIKIHSLRNRVEMEPSHGAVFSDMKNCADFKKALHDSGFTVSETLPDQSS